MAGVEIYNVKAGDTLSKIARDVLGDIDRWPDIARLNNLVQPYTIYPNMALIMPDTTVLGPVVQPAGDRGPPAPTRTPPPYPTAAPDIAGFLAGVNPIVYYAAAAVLLFVLLGTKK